MEKFVELDPNELIEMNGGDRGGLFYELGWWLASITKKKPEPNLGLSGGHF